MNNRILSTFLVLIRRELWETKRLFIAAPVVLTLVMSVSIVWAIPRIPAAVLEEYLGRFGSITSGISGVDLAPFLMPIAIPFMVILYLCTLIYLINALYQDRKDSSILFWQSLPVSNLLTVLSKVVTVSLVAPVFVVAAIFALFMVTIITVYFLGSSYGLEIATFGQMLVAALYSLVLVYMTAVLAALWLFPTAGWFLMFSAFSRNLPFLWAIGAFILLLFVEDLVFGTQFLGNWLESRTTNYNYIIFDAGDFFQRLFSYDMLFGIVLGALLITGAVYMRRFAE